MALLKLEDIDPDYSAALASDHIQDLEVYIEATNDKLGSLSTILVDESGYLRYLVVDFGLWVFNKQILLPVGHCRIDTATQRLYIQSLTRKQAENLPEYNEHVLDGHPTHNYEQDPLYQLNDKDHAHWKHYQDQQLAHRHNRTSQAAQPVAAPAKPQADPASPTSASEQATRHACLIFNPVAGQSDPEQDLATIQQILQPHLNLDIHTTTPEVDADQLAQAAVERGEQMIIACGGDGTLSAAAQAVVGTEIALGIISRGTANAFASALGIPTTIEAACQTIIDGTTRAVDAAYCNGRPMVLLAGIGFEARTVERTERAAKDRFGSLAYVLAGFQELRDNPQHFQAEVETDDKVIRLDALALTVANAAPPTSVLAQGPAELVIDDGLLDVTLVAPANAMSAITAAYDLLQSALSRDTTQRSDTGYLQAKRLKVRTKPPQQVVVDGELAGQTPIEIECIPRGLTIFVPLRPLEDPVENLEGLPELRVELKPQADS